MSKINLLMSVVRKKVTVVRIRNSLKSRAKLWDPYFFLNITPEEFKTGFGKIVEFRPSGTKGRNHIFRGGLLNKVLFSTMKKQF